MKIQWHGETCFTFKGKYTATCIDPYANGKHNLKSVDAASIMLTNDYDGGAQLVPGSEKAIVFNWPGEYEVQDTTIIGIPAYTKEKEEGDTAKGRIVIFSFMLDGIRMCHLGELGVELDDIGLEKIGAVDILMVSAGGNNVLDPKKMHATIEQIEPRVVIFMNHTPADLEAVVKEIGIQMPEPIDSFNVQEKSQLPEERTDFVVLNAV
ncbi:MBL fold metallo-hydrolase [Patescibacteria group bacterium]|nr:MBL fold metallo-hydrolase [Patescibacteria group bacterium]